MPLLGLSRRRWPVVLSGRPACSIAPVPIRTGALTFPYSNTMIDETDVDELRQTIEEQQALLADLREQAETVGDDEEREQLLSKIGALESDLAEQREVVAENIALRDQLAAREVSRDPAPTSKDDIRGYR